MVLLSTYNYCIYVKTGSVYCGLWALAGVGSHLGRDGAELSRDLVCGQFIDELALSGDADIIVGIVSWDALCIRSSMGFCMGFSMVATYESGCELHSCLLYTSDAADE